MDELFESLSEVDVGKALRTAAVVGAIGGAAMVGDKLASTPQKEPPEVKQVVEPSMEKEEVVDIDMDRIIQIESSGNPKAVNRKTGARGLCQLMEPTWNEMIKRMKVGWEWDEAFDAEKNLAVGTYYMNTEIPRLLKHFGIPDTVETRLAAYNWGVGNLYKLRTKYGDEWLPGLPRETLDFMKKYKAVGEAVAARKNAYSIQKYNPDVGELMVRAETTGKYYKYSGVSPYIYDQISKWADREAYAKGWQILRNLERQEQRVEESSIDFPRQALDPSVWQKVDNTYELRRATKDHILKILDRYEKESLRAIARAIRIVGSICTNQYTDYVDIDVHIEPKDKLKYTAEDQVEVIKWFNENRDEIDGWIDDHPIEVYLQLDPNQDLLSDGVYDLLNDMWVKGPKIADMSYDPYEDFKGIADEVRNQVAKADELFGELKRDVIDYEVIKDAMGKMPSETKELFLKRLGSKLEEIEDDIEALYSRRGEWTTMRRRASKPTTPEQAREDIELARRWKDTNAVFKFISRYQYLRTIGDLEALIRDEQVTPDEISVIKNIMRRSYV